MNAVQSPAERPGRLRVGVVGAGRVGSVLGWALLQAGHRVVAVSGVSQASRERAATMLPGVPVLPADDVARACDLLLLTVPDDALPSLVLGLARTGAVRRGQLVAHASGRHGTDVLEPVVVEGALPLALHPVMTFTDAVVDAARLSGASFGVTAPEPLRPVAEALVVEMGGEPVWIAEEHRALYHAALATASNHLVTLIAEAMDLLRRAGVAEPGRMLGPLTGATLDNALRYGDAALTGPVARGDAGTVAAHVHVLAPLGREPLAAYLAMARLTADRALASGQLRPERAEALLGVLAAPDDGRRA